MSTYKFVKLILIRVGRWDFQFSCGFGQFMVWFFSFALQGKQVRLIDKNEITERDYRF